jgi:hypothetical protein
MRSIAIIIVAIGIISISGCVQPQSAPKVSEHTVSSQWKPDGVIGDNEYSRSMILQSPGTSGYSGGTLEIFWKNDAQYLYMALKGSTKGWMSIGFEPTVWMKDADMIMATASKNNATILDEYSTGNYGPHLNDTQLGGTYDILEAGGREEGNYTVIEFKRRMNTGDKFDKAFVQGQNVSIIWAMADAKDPEFKHNVAKGEGVLGLEG